MSGKRRSKAEVDKVIEKIKEEVKGGMAVTVAAKKHGLAYQVYMRYAGGSASKSKTGSKVNISKMFKDLVAAIRAEEQMKLEKKLKKIL